MAPLMRTDTPDFPILVFNGGSSSIKFSIYAAEGTSLRLLYGGEASGIGTPEAQFHFFEVQAGTRQLKISESNPSALGSFRDAVGKIASGLQQPGIPPPAAIGHRVVHSGPKLHAHQRITPEVLADIEQAASFAPLHQPIALEILHESMCHFRGVANYACFDTVFHQTMPEVASIYPLPREIRDQGVRRYGFHGISCESILRQFEDGFSSRSQHDGEIPARLIIAHLGSGASLTAVRNGKSLDTTMGLTPCGGVLMGTRPGDLDPGVIFYLSRTLPTGTANATDAIEQMLNKHSGLLALSGLSNDMRLLHDAADHGNSQAALAIDAFVRSVKKAIGGFIALMGGVDAVVFTGGIGEHDASARSSICAGLEAFGLTLDPTKNDGVQSGARTISRQESTIAVYVLTAEEDRVIAGHVARMAQEP
ncbi:MAG: acetate/propionate family kinase [Acidobacteriaceae bacterium]